MIKEMTCRQAVGCLMRYVEDRLSSIERRALESHFVICHRCLEFAQSYVQTPRIVREATNTLIPAKTARRLRRQIARLKKSKE